MGCCSSRSAGPNSPYPAGGHNASARHINPPEAPSSAAARHRALHQQINKPLRRHQWTDHDRHWTRRRLDLERADFFDTRVTGRTHIWQTIHAALQVLGQPHESDDDYHDALATAQSILSAADISLPTGDLANGVYDSLGNYYQLPDWVVADPTNLVTTTTAIDPDSHLSSSDADDVQRTRADKGKAVVHLHEHILLRARLSETGRDIELAVDRADLVRAVAAGIASEADLPSNKKIRLAYMGKMLKDNSSLESQGWQPGHMVNAFVFPR